MKSHLQFPWLEIASPSLNNITDNGCDQTGCLLLSGAGADCLPCANQNGQIWNATLGKTRTTLHAPVQMDTSVPQPEVGPKPWQIMERMLWNGSTLYRGLSVESVPGLLSHTSGMSPAMQPGGSSLQHSGGGALGCLEAAFQRAVHFGQL